MAVAWQALAFVMVATASLELARPSLLFAQPPADAAWHLLKIPDAWRKVPAGELAPQDGYSWYRCLVKVPARWRGDPLTLFVEPLDDARAAYFNGVAVGATGTFPPQFRSGLGERGQYSIDTSLVRFGDFNTVAIRVFQNDPRPNFNVAPPIVANAGGTQAIRMSGSWQYRPGDDATWAKASLADFGASAASEAEPAKRGVYLSVDDVSDIDSYVARREGDNDPYSPEAAEKTFTTSAGLEFQLVLSEPEITQPIFMNWDARGRLWVMEYRQYPDVAGLQMVSRDVYLRTVYDKVPAAPPNHVKGRDRISIHEDSDLDGVFDTHKVFVDGLNLATSFAHGRGGVWVTNPPYLLFYPDRNEDDIPDGDPEVHLEGFGIEDSHSVINSLRFGPDGWLYAAQGSTVTGRIKRPGSEQEPHYSMGQLIWRYHPERRKYEVFAEGGGNTFGVEIDAKGRIYSGHNGGNTRGFHYVQGGYYRKGFGKHGPLSNPYAFGFFPQMRHHDVPRFTHNFVIYESGVLPDDYSGRLFGIEPLQGQVVLSRIEPHQSSFQTHDLARVVETDDQWFRPVDIKVGPDGFIYVSDMYEQGISHSSHYAGRIDRTNGRIYRLKPQQSIQTQPVTYSQLSSEELLGLLDSPNKWQRQTVLRLLGDRADRSIVPLLLRRIPHERGQLALEFLWALHLSHGLTDDAAVAMLRHEDRFVRAWTVRLVCDDWVVSSRLAAALAEQAFEEPYIEVRKQLASSARRLRPQDALPIIRNLLRHDDDSHDLHQPLLIWWALEAQASNAGRDLIVDLLSSDDQVWQRPLFKEHLVERLMRRFALAGSRQELQAAAELISAAPDRDSINLLLRGFEDAYQGRPLVGIPSQLAEAISAAGGGSLALRLRRGDPEAIQQAIELAANPDAPRDERLQCIQIFADLRRPEFVEVLLDLVSQQNDESLISAALAALQPHDVPAIAGRIVRQWDEIPEHARLTAETLLASRKSWALTLLDAVDAGKLGAASVSETAVRKILLHDHPRIRELVTEHWGPVAGATTQQMREETERIGRLLDSGSGNPKRGKPLFTQHCGKCHLLFGEGGQVGPDLTPFKRDDVERVLINVVNPSAEIREGFENYLVITEDGRAVNGFLADQDNQIVVLRGVDGQNLFFQREEIDELQKLSRSVMPEGTLKPLDEQEIRDLFAYLRSSQPVNY